MPMQSIKIVFVKKFNELINEIIKYIKIDYIDIVPSHKKKVLIRGFDHLEILLPHLTPIIPIKRILKKTVHKDSQVSFKLKEARQINIKNTFSIINNQKLINLINNKSVLIIDDICTSGSTLDECARVLKLFGVKKVYSLTLAKD